MMSFLGQIAARQPRFDKSAGPKTQDRDAVRTTNTNGDPAEPYRGLQEVHAPWRAAQARWQGIATSHFQEEALRSPLQVESPSSLLAEPPSSRYR